MWLLIRNISGALEKKKKAIPGHLYFSKNSKVILICIWVLKSDYRIFLSNGSFDDIEFYKFSVD